MATNSSSAANPRLSECIARIRKEKDFPSISEHIESVCRLAATDRDVSVSDLANEILKDFALTNRLLKRVNSAYYGQSGEEILTISRAISVLGFEQVRNAALGLMLFEHLKTRSSTHDLIDATNRSLFSGLVAARLADHIESADMEEARVCAMFRNLGKLLVLFYFPKEYAQIREETRTGLSPRKACRRVLGVSYAEIGVEIARMWNFPEAILESMSDLPVSSKNGPVTPRETLPILSGLSNELSEAVSDPDAERRAAAMQALTLRCSENFGLEAPDVDGILRESLEDADSDAGMITLNGKSGTFLKNLRRNVEGWNEELPAPSNGDSEEDVAEFAEDTEKKRGSTPDPRELLLRGIQEITSTLLGEFRMDDVIRIVLETMYRALGFSHVMFCVTEPKRAMMVARFGFGREIERFKNEFGIPTASKTPDPFSNAVSTGEDLFIEDTSAPDWRDHIPPWHRTLVPARSVLILPIRLNGMTLGLFYADEVKDGAPTRMSGEILSHLKTLRDHTVLALKTGK